MRAVAKRTLPRGRKAAKPVGESKWLWILLLLNVFFEYMRPQDGLLSFLAPLRLAGLVTLALAVSFLIRNKDYLKDDRLNLMVFLFWLFVAASTLWAVNDRAAFNTTVSLFWLYTAYVYPINMVLTTPQRIYRFVFWWMAIQTCLSLYVATHVGHGPGGFLLDENDVALAINMAIPFIAYTAQFPDLSRKARLFLYLAAACCLVAIGIAASRGSVVGLGVLVFAMVALSKHPVRNLIVTGSVALIGLAILVRFLPPAYVEDMQGIDDPQDGTADYRLWSWSIGWEMYKGNPVAGVGAGNYPWNVNVYAPKSPMYTPDREVLGGRVAHSLYFTLLPELGTVGVIIFVTILRMLYNRYREIRSIRAPPELEVDRVKFDLLAKAMIVSCVAYLITGAFISVLYYPPFWHLIGLVVAATRVARMHFSPVKGAAHAS